MKDALKFSLSLIAFVLTLFITTDVNGACKSCNYTIDDGKCERLQDGTRNCKSAVWSKDCNLNPPTPCL